MISQRILHFYSVWALILHILSMKYHGVIGCTFTIAVFCWIVNNYFVFVWPKYLTWYTPKDVLVDFALHWAPLFLLPVCWGGTKLLVVSFFVYLVVMGDSVWDAYSNPRAYLNAI